MNILLNYSHEIQLKLLSELNHDFYIPNHHAQWNDTVLEDYQTFYPGDNPSNLYFDEYIEKPDVIVNGKNADINLLNNPNASVKKGCVNAYITESLLALKPPSNKVFFLLGKGTDTDRFSGWVSGDKIIAVGNNMGKRTHVFDKEQLNNLKDEFGDDFKAYGKGVGCDEFVPHCELHEVLKKAKLFVNLAYNSIFPNSLLEAMSVGVPIVSVYSPTITDYLTHKYNSLITNDVVKGVNTLLDSNIDRIKFSIRSRKKAVGKYDKYEYLQRWDNLLNMVYMSKRR